MEPFWTMGSSPRIQGSCRKFRIVCCFKDVPFSRLTLLLLKSFITPVGLDKRRSSLLICHSLEQGWAKSSSQREFGPWWVLPGPAHDTFCHPWVHSGAGAVLWLDCASRQPRARSLLLAAAASPSPIVLAGTRVHPWPSLGLACFYSGCTLTVVDQLLTSWDSSAQPRPWPAPHPLQTTHPWWVVVTAVAAGHKLLLGTGEKADPSLCWVLLAVVPSS